MRAANEPSLIASRSRAIRIAFLLVTADLIFIFLHLLYRFSGLFTDPRLRIDIDRGFAEMYQYAKIAAVTVMLVWLFIQHRKVIYLAFVPVFVYLLADDAWMLHEKLGGWLSDSQNWATFLNLRGQDQGEVVVTTAFGAALFSVVGLAYLRSQPPERRICRILLALIGVLAFFGVGVDLAHFLAQDILPKHLTGVFVEDGGEMGAMSLIVAYSAFLVFSASRESVREIQAVSWNAMI